MNMGRFAKILFRCGRGGLFDCSAVCNSSTCIHIQRVSDLSSARLVGALVERIATADVWRRAIVNSLIIGSGTTILATVLGTMAALGLLAGFYFF